MKEDLVYESETQDFNHVSAMSHRGDSGNIN